jgi:hypothetical protein
MTVAPSFEDSDVAMSDSRSRRKARWRVRKATDDAYPWIKHTPALYTPVLEIHNGCLCSLAHHSVPKALLNQDLFETIHAILFLTNMDSRQMLLQHIRIQSFQPLFSRRSEMNPMYTHFNPKLPSTWVKEPRGIEISVS